MKHLIFTDTKIGGGAIAICGIKLKQVKLVDPSEESTSYLEQSWEGICLGCLRKLYDNISVQLKGFDVVYGKTPKAPHRAAA